MGKVRRTKSKPHKDSAPVPQTEDLEPPLESARENVIQTIMDQLQGPSVEEKYCGLQTLAQFVENPENVPQVMESDIVKAAAPLLFDSAPSVRNAAAGTLRNLSVTNLESCEMMIKDDVMTPLVAYFHEYAEKWTPLPEKSKVDDDTDTFVQCVNLLWNLCEISETALKYFNQSRIINTLSRCLDITAFKKDVIISVLQCLFVVTEDNFKIIDNVKTQCEEKIEKLLHLDCQDDSETHILLIKTLSAGVVMNICSGNIASLPPATIKCLITVLSETLAVDHRKVCNDLTNFIPLDVNEKGALKKDNKDLIKLEEKVKEVTHLLEAQQCAVEILANLCSSGDIEDQSEEDYTSGTEDLEESISNEDMNGCSNNGTAFETLDRLPAELLEAIQAFELVAKVYSRALLPAINVVMMLEEVERTQSISKKLKNLQSRALLCVNNMVTSLPIEMLNGTEGIYKLWLDTGKLVFGETSSQNSVLLESATAVMRSALDKLKGTQYDQTLFANLSITDIEMMCRGAHECQVAAVRAHVLRALGTLALLLQANRDDLRICISNFLLTHAHKESEVWVLAEILDALMDMYAEDDTDLLAANVKLVDKLSALAPILKNKARQHRKHLGEHAGIVHTAVTNLPRFIKYKKDRVSKLNG